ncbi:MAG: hypothetical protein ACE5D6_10105 [Candidatus Zixiibacteriota bacterium]
MGSSERTSEGVYPELIKGSGGCPDLVGRVLLGVQIIINSL